mmetsp:Transcript_36321/g.47900  ORF Transcript_36321/g.47900 Transcript_36321/m.47900 type:complete len:213 (-) Transcript_36321:172-810(-)
MPLNSANFFLVVVVSIHFLHSSGFSIHTNSVDRSGTTAIQNTSPCPDIGSRKHKNNLFKLPTSRHSLLRLRSLADRTNLAEEEYGDESLVVKVTGQEEYLQILEDNRDRIVVIKFFAPWCRSCKALGLKFEKWAKGKYAGKPITFAEMDLFDRENKPVKQNLGISVIPMIHIHRGTAGKVEEFTCGPSKFQLFCDKLDAQIIIHADSKSTRV